MKKAAVIISVILICVVVAMGLMYMTICACAPIEPPHNSIQNTQPASNR